MNKKHTTLLLLVASAIFCLAFCANDAFAGGWAGTGIYKSGTNPGGSGSGSGSGTYAKGNYWIKFYLQDDFRNNPSLASNSVYIAPQYRDYNEVPPTISSDCNTGNSEGVWIFGQTSNESTTVFDGYFWYPYGQTFYNGIGGEYRGYGYTTWSGYLLKYYYKDAERKEQITDTYVDNNGHYSIYRRSKSGLGIYNVLSSAGQDAKWGDTNEDGETDIEATIHSIYYSNGGAPVLAYQTKADSIAANKDKIVSEYKNYMKNATDSAGRPLYSDAEINSMTYEKMTAEKGDGSSIYAFCAYPEKTRVDATVEGSATITVGGKTASTGYDKSTASADLGTVNEPTISFSTHFDLKRDKESPNMSFTAHFNRPNDESAYDKTLTFNSSELLNQQTASGTVNLSVGENTICSSMKYPSTINDEETVKYASDSPSRTACVKVNFVPLEATIKSKTRVSVRLDSGVASSESVEDNGRDGEPVDNYNIPYGKQIDVDWSHALGVSRVVKKDGHNTNVDPLSGNFNIKYSNLSYDLGSSKSTWSLPSGTNYNRDLNSWNLSGSSVDLKKADDSVIKLNDTDYVKLLPGDNKTITKGIVHPETVKNDKDNTSGGEEKASSRKVSLSANNVKCEFSGQEMGVGNANNYAKMSFSVDDGSAAVSRTVGDAIKDDGSIFNANETVWLKGNNSRMQLSYSICDGAQIAYDKAYLDRNPGTDWTNEIASTKDRFEVMNITSDGNDISTSLTTLNNNWYKNTFNGGPARSIKISNSDPFNAKSINGDEIGDNGSLQARVDAGYQALDQKTSKAAKVNDQLGQSVENTISFRTSYDNATEKTYSITTNVPYNYIIDPNLNGVEGGVIYLGSEISASANFAVRERINEKVNESTGSSGAKYKTNTKTSKYYTAVFTIDEGTDADGLMGRITGSGATRMKDSSSKDTKDFYIQSDYDFENILSGQIGAKIVSSSADKDNPAKTTVSEATIGTKYCAVAAVWPADSHNIMNQEDSDNALKVPLGDAQTNALSGDVSGAGAYWRFEISCQTVGKKPTMSVEGHGVVTGGSVNTSTTNFDGRVFGSWSEYGLIADNGSTPKFGTGASLAYTQAQRGFNMPSAPYLSGLSKDSKCIGIQTVGNLDCENQVGVTNAREYLSSAETIKGQIISRNGITKSGDKYVISDNITKNADGTTPIIYADDIKIAPGVEEINAILIADNNLDTCYEEVDGKEADYTQQGKTEGNSGLKDHCAEQLLIRGAVFAKSITLDRTFGGGGYIYNIAAESLVRRAEIFDFDPTYIKEVYEKSLDNEPIITTYIKELPSRY